MKYFSFVYDQRTLIVAAPDDNKGQEKFLGYKWSNRKGQERQLQDEFADFVQSVEKSKFECIGKKEKFEIEKDTFVHKYFR